MVGMGCVLGERIRVESPASVARAGNSTGACQGQIGVVYAQVAACVGDLLTSSRALWNAPGRARSAWSIPSEGARLFEPILLRWREVASPDRALPPLDRAMQGFGVGEEVYGGRFPERDADLYHLFDQPVDVCSVEPGEVDCGEITEEMHATTRACIESLSRSCQRVPLAR